MKLALRMLAMEGLVILQFPLITENAFMFLRLHVEFDNFPWLSSIYTYALFMATIQYTFFCLSPSASIMGWSISRVKKFKIFLISSLKHLQACHTSHYLTHCTTWHLTANLIEKSKIRSQRLINATKLMICYRIMMMSVNIATFLKTICSDDFSQIGRINPLGGISSLNFNGYVVRILLGSNKICFK